MEKEFKKRIFPYIDAISNNCRERNKFFSLIEKFDLPTTMSYLNWPEEKQKYIANKWEELKIKSEAQS
jgi:hypothetical protein